jgi:hypothetical protein
MRDDKLVRVAIRAKQPVERVVWVWGAILESAAEIDDGGRHDLAADEAAYFLRTDEADIGAIIAALTLAGRLDQDRVVNWGQRQFASDKSKDRQAAYRQRQKEGGASERGDSDSPEGDGDAEVTSRRRHGDAPKTEAETEESPNGDSQSALNEKHVLEAYQDLARELGLSVPRDLTPSRRQLLKARIKQYPIEDFLTVIAKCRGSPFLRGERGRGSPLTFDWLFKRENFQKVLEGNYDG